MTLAWKGKIHKSPPKLNLSIFRLTGKCKCVTGMHENDGGVCVLPSHCPCHHDGKIWEMGKIVKLSPCKTCTCSNGMWECDETTCPSTAFVTIMGELIAQTDRLIYNHLQVISTHLTAFTMVSTGMSVSIFSSARKTRPNHSFQSMLLHVERTRRLAVSRDSISFSS